MVSWVREMKGVGGELYCGRMVKGDHFIDKELCGDVVDAGVGGDIISMTSEWRDRIVVSS